MDAGPGKIAPLVGSVYDLAAMYELFINGEKSLKGDRHQELIGALNRILDNGYTYLDVRNEILATFHGDKMFPFYKFNKQVECNLLKSGIRYYHKQLNLMSSPGRVTHNIDSGEITSQGDDFWIEPRASYTPKDFADYMYSKGMMDKDEFPPKRLYGLIRSVVAQYGLELSLYMVESCARQYEDDKQMFTLRSFDMSRSTAVRYLEEVKNNCVYSGVKDYVQRERVLSG